MTNAWCMTTLPTHFITNNWCIFTPSYSETGEGDRGVGGQEKWNLSATRWNKQWSCLLHCLVFSFGMLWKKSITGDGHLITLHGGWKMFDHDVGTGNFWQTVSFPFPVLAPPSAIHKDWPSYTYLNRIPRFSYASFILIGPLGLLLSHFLSLPSSAVYPPWN